MKKVLALLLVLSLMLNPTPVFAFTVYDPINAALNSLRNALMQSEHVEKVMLLLDQIRQLKSTYEEMLRFNFGLDDILRLAVGDLSDVGGYLFDLSDTRVFNLGYETKQSVRSLIQIVEGESSSGARSSYETLFGKDPNSEFRPDLTYQDIRALNALRIAGEMMKESKKTKEAGKKISEASYTASPKGAARLTADALGKLLVTSATTHESLARLIELQANELSREAMEDKQAESARLKFIQDFDEIVNALGRQDRWES